MNPRVIVDHLSIRYPRASRPALADVSLEIGGGELLLLLGTTGSGKSTLALTLDGLVPQAISAEQHGSVSVDGLDTVETALETLTARVALVFQDPYAQFCLLRVDEEVAFSLENQGLPREMMPARVAAALAQAGAAHLAGRRLDTLSGGEAQRVIIAAALAGAPSTIVFDEPTASLDPLAAVAFADILDDLRSNGTTVLLIEHRLESVIASADRLAVLDGGRLVTAGKPAPVMRQAGGALAAAGVWVPESVDLALRFAATADPLDGAAVLADPVVAAGLTAAAASDEPRSVPAAAPPFVVVDGASFGLGTAPFVVDTSLTVAPGQMVGLVGANGSGKSTLLLGLAGLARRFSGTVQAAGAAMVFQNPEHQFVASTVWEEIAAGVPRGPERESVVRQTLDDYGLKGLEAQNPFRLSQGQKRRLSLAAITVTMPRVLLADEPTFGQDRSAAFAVMAALRGAADDGAAVLFASHEPRLVAEFADRVLVLDGGRIVADVATGDFFAADDLIVQAAAVRPLLVRWWLAAGRPGSLRAVMQAGRLA